MLIPFVLSLHLTSLSEQNDGSSWCQLTLVKNVVGAWVELWYARREEQETAEQESDRSVLRPKPFSTSSVLFLFPVGAPQVEAAPDSSVGAAEHEGAAVDVRPTVARCLICLGDLARCGRGTLTDRQTEPTSPLHLTACSLSVWPGAEHSGSLRVKSRSALQCAGYFRSVRCVLNGTRGW